MKTFTRVALGVAGLLAGLGLCWAGSQGENVLLLPAGGAVALAALAWTYWSVRSSSRRRRASSETVQQEVSASVKRSKPASSQPPGDPNDLVGEMLWQSRYALLMRPQVAANLSKDQIAQANAAMEEHMAMVPEGDVFMSQPDDRDGDERPVRTSGQVVRVEAALLDRHPVTNHQFKQFMEAGGYEQMALWDANIWPAVFGFTDLTGQTGPHYWKDGSYPRGEDDHPVVGVSWHEANAYARWVGKRLASDAEWVKAGCWPMPTPRGLPKQRRYPWGDAWEPDRANIWSAGLGRTCPVVDFDAGASVAGVYQLVGNVWEWTGDAFGLWHRWAGGQEPDESLKSLRGGAFDTYFESQATCQFQSGDSPLARKHNIGFRCAIGLCDLRPAAVEPASDEPAEHELVCEEV